MFESKWLRHYPDKMFWCFGGGADGGDGGGIGGGDATAGDFGAGYDAGGFGGYGGYGGGYGSSADAPGTGSYGGGTDAAFGGSAFDTSYGGVSNFGTGTGGFSAADYEAFAAAPGTPVGSQTPAGSTFFGTVGAGAQQDLSGGFATDPGLGSIGYVGSNSPGVGQQGTSVAGDVGFGGYGGMGLGGGSQGFGDADAGAGAGGAGGGPGGGSVGGAGAGTGGGGASSSGGAGQIGGTSTGSYGGAGGGGSGGGGAAGGISYDSGLQGLNRMGVATNNMGGPLNDTYGQALARMQNSGQPLTQANINYLNVLQGQEQGMRARTQAGTPLSTQSPFPAPSPQPLSTQEIRGRFSDIPGKAGAGFVGPPVNLGSFPEPGVPDFNTRFGDAGAGPRGGFSGAPGPTVGLPDFLNAPPRQPGFTRGLNEPLNTPFKEIAVRSANPDFPADFNTRFGYGSPGLPSNFDLSLDPGSPSNITGIDPQGSPTRGYLPGIPGMPGFNPSAPQQIASPRPSPLQGWPSIPVMQTPLPNIRSIPEPSYMKGVPPELQSRGINLSPPSYRSPTRLTVGPGSIEAPSTPSFTAPTGRSFPTSYNPFSTMPQGSPSDGGIPLPSFQDLPSYSRPSYTAPTVTQAFINSIPGGMMDVVKRRF